MTYHYNFDVSEKIITIFISKKTNFSYKMATFRKLPPMAKGLFVHVEPDFLSNRKSYYLDYRGFITSGRLR